MNTSNIKLILDTSEPNNEGFVVFKVPVDQLQGISPEAFVEALDHYVEDALVDAKEETVEYDPALGDFVKARLVEVGASSFEVDVDYSFSTVCIKDLLPDPQDDIFMQGEEADNFIDEVENLYNRTGNLGLDEAEMFVALPYVETI